MVFFYYFARSSAHTIAVNLGSKSAELCDSPLERGGGVCFCFDKLIAEHTPSTTRSYARALEFKFTHKITNLQFQ
jgi:hypothetical protein